MTWDQMIRKCDNVEGQMDRVLRERISGGGVVVGDVIEEIRDLAIVLRETVKEVRKLKGARQ